MNKGIDDPSDWSLQPKRRWPSLQTFFGNLRQFTEKLPQVDLNSLLTSESGMELLRTVVDTVRKSRGSTGISNELHIGPFFAVAAQLLSLSALRVFHIRLMNQRREALQDPSDEALSIVLDDIERFIEMLRLAGRIIDDNDHRDEVQELLSFWNNVLYRAGRPSTVDFLDDFDPRLAPTIPDHLCPYLGLSAFRETDAGYFFGRQRSVTQLVEMLATQRLLAVLGPSGSGKSSVVQAGLIPSLQAGTLPNSRDWYYLPVMVPGSHPLTNLAVVLDTPAVPPNRVSSSLSTPPYDTGVVQVSLYAGENAGLISEIQLPSTAIHRRDQLRIDGNAVLAMIPASLAHPVVLIIDQFEELFTLCTDEAERKQFLAALLALVTDPGVPHRVILTMRGDFEPFITRAEVFLPLFEAGRVTIAPLNAAELREAIERPADKVGLRFETGITENLLQELLGEPAALPLLQFTLLKLWERRQRNRITLTAYQEVGGGRRALAKAADALYANLIPEDQMTARRLLLRLVRPGEGLEVTSNRVRRADLLTLREDPGRIERVLTKLVDAHLVRLTFSKVPDDDQVEIAHEALVRNWPTLVEWLEDERLTLRQRQRLTAATEQWARHGNDPGALLRGALLDEARRYDDLNLLEQQFVQASIHDQKRVEHEREQTIHHLEQLTKELEQQRRRADIQRLAFAAQSLTYNDPELALLLAAEAATREDTPLTHQALRIVLTKAERTPIVLDEHRAPLIVGAVSRSKPYFATGAADGSICLWSFEGYLLQRLNGHKHVVESMSFSPDGQKLLTGSRDGTARLWDLDKGKAQRIVREHTDTVRAICWSPDGKSFITASHDTRAMVWSANGSLRTVLEGHRDSIRDVDISPDGKWLVTASRDHSARLWTLTGHLVVELTGHRDGLTQAKFSPNGQQILTCSWDGDARLWSIHGKGREVLPLQGHRGPITSSAFNKDGSLIATTSWDGTTRIWDATGRSVGILTGQAGLIRCVAFSDDDQSVITGSSDGTTRIWGLHGNEIAVLGGHTEQIQYVKFLPGSHRVLTVSRDGTARVWAEPTKPYEVFDGHTSSINAVALSPDNHTMATASDDGTVLLWSGATLSRCVLRSGQVQKALDFSPDGSLLAVGGELGAFIFGIHDEAHVVVLPHSSSVMTVSFSPDGQQILTGGADHRALLWSTDGKLIRTYEAHKGIVHAVVWFPDNSGRSITVAADRSVCVWASNGQLLAHHYRMQTGRLISAAMSLDGRKLITGSADKSARVWDVETWRLEREVVHSGWVEGLAVMPEGQGFASASRDGIVRLWSWDGELVNMLRSHIGGARSLAFSLDGRSVVVGAGDGSVRRYPIRTEDLLDMAATRLGRGLTEEELFLFGLTSPLSFQAHKHRHPLPRIGIMDED
ncbi:WD40 repeat domain-containing protein [Candidatus Chloroploca sp. Khr17]|uniref:WD40 repeat domain-containing protein n=1 Tax=Candidatus Chloroploca sp. Khr17 TaxID=2496869 RepID=UPI00101DE4D7|nr:WD40 repeat domain-containing protein [Candidatus Chloroploca sp. Khr17]